MNEEEKITVGSLFSGIGGIELGLDRTGGFETRWFCEYAKFPQRVLRERWPGATIYSDVRELYNGTTPERVDMLTGGFPCQPFSHAGRRKGEADNRFLWPEFCRIIRQVKPRWVLAENVPGLFTNDSGRVFGRVLRDLAFCGYDVEWDVISAASIGAVHRRDRIFFLGHLRDSIIEPGCKERGVREGKATNSSRVRPEGDVADAVCRCKGEHSRELRQEEAEVRGEEKGCLPHGCCEVLADANCLCGSGSIKCECGGGESQEEIGRRGCALPNSHKGRLPLQGTELQPAGIARCHSQEARDVSNPLRTGSPCPRTELRAIQPIEIHPEGGADVPNPQGERGWRGYVRWNGTYRYVGPLERARADNRLRAYCDDVGKWWAVEPDVGRVAHGVPARVDRLKALGNAVVPQVAQYIGMCILEWERDTR